MNTETEDNQAPSVQKQANINFEQSLQKLEQIASRLEADDIDLDKAIKLFEEGVLLAKNCQAVLRKAEQKVQVLTQENGQIKTTNLSSWQHEDK